MAVQTYTKTGTKSQTAAKLDAKVFGVVPEKHDLLKAAYVTYLANGRPNLAVTKTRGLVQGTTRKHHRQKGTGRARAGSARNPLWVGGGIVFGPTGQENYSRQINVKAKRQALRQALSLAAQDGHVKVIEAFSNLDGKTRDLAKFLDKIEAAGNIMCVVSQKDPAKEKAARNLPNLKVRAAASLNVYDILNADTIVISKEALAIISDWLGGKK